MQIDNIKDVLGRIMTINKNLTEDSLRNLLTAANWDIDDINQGVDVFNYYNKGKVVSERGPTAGEVYAKLKAAKDKEISLQIEEEKKRLKEKALKAESVEEVSDAVAGEFLNKNYEDEVMSNIQKLKSELETLRKRNDYVAGGEEEKLLLESIDSLSKKPEITDIKVEHKGMVIDDKIKDNISTEDKNVITENKIEDKVQEKDDNSHIEQATQVFIKGEKEDMNNITSDKIADNTNNMVDMKDKENNYSTNILAFVDAILLIIIILIAIYMLIY